MSIKIERSYGMCEGCGLKTAIKKIVAENTRKEIELCGSCFIALKNKLSSIK